MSIISVILPQLQVKSSRASEKQTNMCRFSVTGIKLIHWVNVFWDYHLIPNEKKTVY